MTEVKQNPKVKRLDEIASQYKTRIPAANQAAVNAPFKQEPKVEAPTQKKTTPQVHRLRQKSPLHHQFVT